MPEKTGKTLEEWKKVLASKSFSSHTEGVRYLKEEYGVTHGFANTIVTLSKDENDTADDLVKNQYKGKENLFPIYEKLIAAVIRLGPDVVISPKKTSVSVIRKKQFALIKPAAKTRIDLGLKLGNKSLTQRLGNSGPFGTMCTHRVQISNKDEINQELMNWLNEAYEQSK